MCVSMSGCDAAGTFGKDLLQEYALDEGDMAQIKVRGLQPLAGSGTQTMSALLTWVVVAVGMVALHFGCSDC